VSERCSQARNGFHLPSSTHGPTGRLGSLHLRYLKVFGRPAVAVGAFSYANNDNTPDIDYSALAVLGDFLDQPVMLSLIRVRGARLSEMINGLWRR
jgi:hypothetical protein